MQIIIEEEANKLNESNKQINMPLTYHQHANKDMGDLILPESVR